MTKSMVVAIREAAIGAAVSTMELTQGLHGHQIEAAKIAVRAEVGGYDAYIPAGMTSLERLIDARVSMALMRSMNCMSRTFSPNRACCQVASKHAARSQRVVHKFAWLKRQEPIA